MKRYHDGRWFEDFSLDVINYLRPGDYEEGEELPPDAIIHRIQRRGLNQLIDFLFKNGYIKPQLGENRTEDTKIIHRLIDVIEKARP